MFGMSELEVYQMKYVLQINCQKCRLLQTSCEGNDLKDRENEEAQAVWTGCSFRI